MSVPMNGAIKVNSLMSPVTGDLGPAAVTAGHLMSSCDSWPPDEQPELSKAAVCHQTFVL